MKKIYGIAGVCCLAGIIFIGIAFLLIQGDFTEFNSKNIEQVKECRYEGKAEVSEIWIDSHSEPIEIEVGDVTGPVIKYSENSNHKYSISEEDGILCVERDPDVTPVYFGIDFNRYGITLIVPKQYEGVLDVTNSSGRIEISGFRGKELRVNNAYGGIRLKNTCTEGDVSVKDKSGSIKFEKVECRNCSVINSSGSIVLDDVMAATDLAAGNNAGKIKFEKLDVGGTIGMSNKNGSIKGSVVGNSYEYSINATAVNGSCNLTNSSYGKRNMFMDNYNGSIKVEFIGR